VSQLESWSVDECQLCGLVMWFVNCLVIINLVIGRQLPDSQLVCSQACYQSGKKSAGGGQSISHKAVSSLAGRKLVTSQSVGR
jgi:hypothetical protein